MISGKISWLRLLVGCLALFIAACAPKIYETPYVPPPPPKPQPSPPAVSRPVFYVAVNRLNLRGCAGMDCPKISVLEQNEAVEKLGELDDWFEVIVKRDGRRGWVTSRYLSPEPVTPTPAAPPPETAPPPAETPPPVEKPAPPAKPPAEKPKPAKPEEGTAPPKKKPEEPRPPKPAKPGEGAEPVKPRPPEKPQPPAEKPKPPAEKPAPPVEKPSPPPTEPEQPKKIRIM